MVQKNANAAKKATTLSQMRAAAAQAWSAFKDLQKDQPSFLAEMAAEFRAGREDLINVAWGGLAGMNREPGEPGSPTPQQTTAALEGRDVYLPTDRVASGKTISLEDLRGKAAEQSQSNAMEREHEPELE